MKKAIFLLSLLAWPIVCLCDYHALQIGVSLPLTGPFSEFGEAVRNGFELAVEEQPALRSKIQLLYEDNAYDPKKAVANLRKLVDINHIDIFFVWGNEPALAISPIAEKLKIPTVAIAQYDQVSVNRNYVIRFINSGQQYSETLLSYLRQQKIKRLALVKAELSFFNMLLDGLKEGASRETIDIEVVDTFLPSETDFRSSVVKLKTKKFDLLGLYLGAAQVNLFVKQANELGFHPQLFGATPFESKSVIAGAWPLLEGAIYTHNAVTEAFRDKYTARYHTDVQLAYAANAYDFAILTATLFDGYHGKLGAADILRIYAETKQQIGASGPFHYVNSSRGGKHFDFDIVVRKIWAGGTKEVYRSNYGLK